MRTVDLDTLVSDDYLTIDEGVIHPRQTLMWSLMKNIARKMGIRTDIPFRELTDQEKEIVFRGPAVKWHIVATGMPEDIRFIRESITGRFI